MPGFSFGSGLTNDLVQRFVVHGIDGKVAGTTSLGTIPNPIPSGKIFLPFYASLVFNNTGLGPPGVITTRPTVSIGTNSPNFDDLAASAVLGTLGSVLRVVVQFKAQQPLLLPGVQTFLNITIPAVSVGPFMMDYVVLGVWA